MAIFLLLFFLHLVSAASAQTASSNITLGSSLTPTGNSSWPSPSGLFAFGFFPHNSDGYAVGIFLPDKTVVWTAIRDNPSVPGDVVRLQVTNDGRLILLRRQGQSVEVVSPSQPIASAAMLDTGNFVLYGFNSTVIWQSFDHPTNTLLPGQRLRPEQELFSSASDSDYSRGIFRLKMQSDGNLVQYPINTPDIAAYAYYSTSTAGRGDNVTLNLESDGFLYLFNGSVTLRNLTNGGYPTQDFIYLMRLDVGGIFRLYSFSRNPPGNFTVMWVSTADRCNPIGICGVNAFCVQMDMVPHCQCLPGFESVQSGNNTAGCTRSFSVQGCQKIDARLKYEMIAEVNTEWENDSYESLDTPTEQACGEACLADCNCEAALFRNGRCRKQRLPLRYGRRSLNNPNMALVKTTATTPNTEKITRRKERRSDFLIAGVVLMSLSVCVSAASVYLVYVNRRRRGGGSYKALIKPNLVEEISLQAFTFEDLSQATNGFQQELGRGSSGTVYKGFLQSNQKPVAVKKLEREVSQGGEREFQTELQTIGKTYHRNLVKLLGYCLDKSNKILVFEYMSNGSLADVLFSHDRRRPTWEERIKIARDISRGITYLHEECETQIIHCDIKPQNILMGEDWCAKVSDFGLAKLLRRDQTNTSTGIRGTRGYVAPEWYQKQPITVKADVYSFGVMLIEIICCKRSVDWSRGEEEAVLEQWVYDCYTAGEVGKIVGEEMVEERKVERMVKIGMWCVQDEPSLRPTMKKVLLMLEGTVDIPIPPCPSSFFSSII